MEENRLDEVTVYGGKLSFLIPHEWEELEGEDEPLFSYPGADSGWLRVSLITIKAHEETPTQRLKQLFDGKENVIQDEQTGNWISTRERDTEEAGNKIHLYYWFVANIVEPDLVREAVFSYTVLADRVNDPETKKMVDLIAQVVGLANFDPKVSDSTDTNS